MVFALTMLTALLFVNTVAAASPSYQILRVEVDGNDITGLGSYHVSRGSQMEVEVLVQSFANATEVDDVSVRAEINGYEFGDISAVSDLFKVVESPTPVTYRKVLTLNIPEDIDSSKTYTLRIEVSDDLDEAEMTFQLFIDELRHSVSIFDVLFNPGTTIQAGQPLFVSVRPENLGDNKEENIKVTVIIPELGVQASNFIGRLITQLQEEEERFSFNDRNSLQTDLLVRIPEDAATGMYDVVIQVEYNRGHDIVTEKRTINVVGAPAAEKVQSVINTEATSKRAQADQEVTYRIMIANLGMEKGIYSIQLEGTSPWAEAWVEPGFLTVMPDSTGEVVVHIKPTADAEARDYVFSAKVMLDGQLVNDVIMHTIVAGQEEPASTPVTFKTVLAIIFGILVIVLIVLGLILAFKRSEGNGNVAQQQGQTYY